MSVLYQERLRGQNNPHWKGGNLNKICVICGKEFSVPVSSGKKRKTCSYKCMGLARSMSLARNWKAGSKDLGQLIRQSKKNKGLIKAILKRDKYTCQHCGQVDGDLEVDHIKFFSDILAEFLEHYNVLDIPTFNFELYLIALKYTPFWDKENLRTLCRACNWQRQVARAQVANSPMIR